MTGATRMYRGPARYGAQMDTRGVRRLAAAVVKQVGDDIRQADKALAADPDDARARHVRRSCERFLESSWGRLLLDAAGGFE